MRHFIRPHPQRMRGGVQGFGVVRPGHSGRMVSTEFDPKTLAEAQRTAELGGSTNVDVSRRDLRALGKFKLFDQVLVVDVLEHIEGDRQALKRISDLLQAEGRLGLSVPTLRYPQVFGRAFTPTGTCARATGWRKLHPRLSPRDGHGTSTAAIWGAESPAHAGSSMPAGSPTRSEYSRLSPIGHGYASRMSTPGSARVHPFHSSRTVISRRCSIASRILWNEQ